MKLKTQFYNNPITTATKTNKEKLQLEIYQEGSNVILTSKDGMNRTYPNTTINAVKSQVYRATGADIEWTTFPIHFQDVMRPVARKADGKTNKLCYTMANAR